MFTNWVYKGYEQSDKVILELIPLSTAQESHGVLLTGAPGTYSQEMTWELFTRDPW
jgi:hypothetical protein